jgi:hypothetical protein
MVALADAGVSRFMECGAGGVIGRRTMYNGWDGGLRVPAMRGGLVGCIRTSLLRYVFTVRSVKMAVQLWSQILPTDKRDPEARRGKPWEMVADAGRLGNGR